MHQKSGYRTIASDVVKFGMSPRRNEPLALTPNRKLKVLLHKQQRMQMMRSYLEKWQNALGRTVSPKDLMPVEEAMTFVDQAYGSGAAVALSRDLLEFEIRDPESPHKMEKMLTALLSNWLEDEVVVVLRQSQYGDALPLMMSDVLHSLPKLLVIDGDDVFVTDHDCDSGFIVAYSTNRMIGSIYSVTEFKGWGKYVKDYRSSQDE